MHDTYDIIQPVPQGPGLGLDIDEEAIQRYEV